VVLEAVILAARLAETFPATWVRKDGTTLETVLTAQEYADLASKEPDPPEDGAVRDSACRATRWNTPSGTLEVGAVDDGVTWPGAIVLNDGKDTYEVFAKADFEVQDTLGVLAIVPKVP
jgi:hypothetical protein